MVEIKFEIGDKVVMIKEKMMIRGKIERLHVDLPKPVAIIMLNDGSTRKAYVEDILPDLRPEKKEEKKVAEPKFAEPVEKSEITITPDEFRDITTALIAKEANAGLIGSQLSFAFTLFVARLHEALFVEVGND